MKYNNMQSDVEKQLSRIKKEIARLQSEQTDLEHELEQKPYLQFIGDMVKYQDKNGQFLDWYIHSIFQYEEEELSTVFLVSTTCNKNMFLHFDTLDNEELIDMIEKRIEFL